MAHLPRCILDPHPGRRGQHLGSTSTGKNGPDHDHLQPCLLCRRHHHRPCDGQEQAKRLFCLQGLSEFLGVRDCVCQSSRHPPGRVWNDGLRRDGTHDRGNAKCPNRRTQGHHLGRLDWGCDGTGLPCRHLLLHRQHRQRRHDTYRRASDSNLLRFQRISRRRSCHVNRRYHHCPGELVLPLCTEFSRRLRLCARPRPSFLQLLRQSRPQALRPHKLDPAGPRRQHGFDVHLLWQRDRFQYRPCHID